jgi:hypothetical protein
MKTIGNLKIEQVNQTSEILIAQRAEFSKKKQKKCLMNVSNECAIHQRSGLNSIFVQSATSNGMMTFKRSVRKGESSEIHCGVSESIFKMSFLDRLNLSFCELSTSSLVRQISVNLDEDCEVTLYHQNCWECFFNFDHGVSLIESAELN